MTALIDMLLSDLRPKFELVEKFPNPGTSPLSKSLRGVHHLISLPSKNLLETF